MWHRTYSKQSDKNLGIVSARELFAMRYIGLLKLLNPIAKSNSNPFLKPTTLCYKAFSKASLKV